MATAYEFHFNFSHHQQTSLLNISKMHDANAELNTVANNRKNEKRAYRKCKHCMLAVVRCCQQIFCPAADPLPGGTGRPKFNQLQMVTTFIYKPSLVRIDARNFELSR